jgi:signal transduction histidine kinase
MAKSARSFDTKVRAYEVAAEVYQQSDLYEKAFEYSQQLIHLKDSAKSARSVERLRMFDVQQELTKKQKEVNLLSANQKLQQAELKQQRLIQWGIALVLLVAMAGAWLILNRQKALDKTKRNLEIEKVRNRIARDLHDDLGSSLSSIKILSQVGIEGNNQAQTSLEKIKERSGVLLDSLSDMVWNINTANDSIEQMISRMREFAAEMLEGNGIQYDFNAHIHKEVTLTIEQRKNIYLMFKEVIHNIVKHSKAQSVNISIEFNHQLHITIQDDGVGIMVKNKSGNGLDNLNKRATEIQGKVKISSPLTRGTCVEFHVPIT